MNCIICGRSTGAGIQDTCSGSCFLKALKKENKSIGGYFEIHVEFPDVL